MGRSLKIVVNSAKYRASDEATGSQRIAAMVWFTCDEMRQAIATMPMVGAASTEIGKEAQKLRQIIESWSPAGRGKDR